MENICCIQITCPFCGETHFVMVPENEFKTYQDGALASVAFLSLSAMEREQIISGVCPDCQKSIFGD